MNEDKEIIITSQFISLTKRLLEQGFSLSDIEESAKQAMKIAGYTHFKQQEAELKKFGSKQ